MTSPSTIISGGLAFLVAGFLFGCSPSVESTTSEDATGLITTVKEVEPNEWRIADEQVVADTADSRVIAESYEGVVDTYTLAEVREALNTEETAADTTSNTSNRYYRRHYGGFGILQYALMGYFINRSFGRQSGFYGQPNPRYYVNQQTYNRVNSTAGDQLRSTRTNRTSNTRSTRPSNSRSGYGSGRSTRSFGG